MVYEDEPLEDDESAQARATRLRTAEVIDPPITRAERLMWWLDDHSEPITWTAVGALVLLWLVVKASAR